MLTDSEPQRLDDTLVPPSIEGPEPPAGRAALGVRSRWATLGIVAAYASVASLWAAFQGSNAGPESRTLSAILFVAFSSASLYWLLRRTANVPQRERAAVLQPTSERTAWVDPFRELVEKSDDALWFAPPDRLVVDYMNPGYESIWGQSLDTLRETPSSWLAAVHPDDRERIMNDVTQRYAEGEWRNTYRIVRPDGSVRWVRSYMFMSRDETGRPYRVSGISRDVTDYQNLAEELRQLQRMEPVGRLAGGIAHDFNNLLSVILSYASLMQNKAGSELATPLAEIRRASERAAELTRQLLAFSRQQVLRPQVLELGLVLLGMERMLSRLLGEDIELTIRVQDSTSKVHADPSQIEQVVMNLAVNARDAMPSGGRLTMELSDVSLDDAYAAEHPGLKPGAYVMLTVTDSGVGMNQHTRARMFEPFFTTKETGKGTGLGLSTVFGIVKQSGGHLEVSSDLGHGTTIQVYLPVTQLVEDGALQDGDIPVIPLQGWETLLLVEDDDQVRGVTRAILSGYGYRVLEARNASEALETCARVEGDIHLLLTDIVMPGMSGLTLAQQLAPMRPGMRTLFMSGYTGDERIQREGLNPSVDFLAKPFTPDILLRHVRKVLSTRARELARRYPKA